MEQKTGLAANTTLAFVSKLAQVTRWCPQIWLRSADKLPVWTEEGEEWTEEAGGGGGAGGEGGLGACVPQNNASFL